jgi:Na+-translocating ferredoxin:NAD+ oxidoreductase RnfG subunit
MRRRLEWLRGRRKLYALGIVVDTALISVVMSASVATPVAASGTQTVTVWQPLACLILGAVPSHIGVVLNATIPTSVTPGQQFNMTNVTAIQVLTPAAQTQASLFSANAFEGIVKDFENNLTGATFTLAGGAPSTQLNQVAALQPPNSDHQTGDPNVNLIEGPSPLQAWADQATPVLIGDPLRQKVFSFGPIPVDSSGAASQNTYGPAPGTGGGALVTSGTADALNVVGPFTTTGLAGTNIVIGAGDASRTVLVDGINEVLVAKTTIFFFNPAPTPGFPSGRWSGQISADCGVDTHPTLKVGSPDPSFASNFTIPIVTAPTAPAITTQPANQTVTAGASASFSAAASGNPAPTVQWQVSTNGGGTFSDLAGATTSPLSVPTTDTSKNGYQYRAVFSNGNLPNATSSAATLTVNAAPSAPAVTTQPANQTVTAGASASFSAAASGNPAPTVQWQVSTNGGGTFSDLAGATTSPLSVPTTDTSKNGYQYRAVFSNGNLPNATSSAATLTVNAAPSAPAVTTQPANQTVTAGASASFSAAASGNPAPTVQWQVSTNGGGTFSDLAGATSSPLSVATTDTSKNGYQYRAVFSNGNLPNATSSAATLTVNAAPVAPSVTTQPSNQTVTAGASASFSAAASGNPAPTVQWQVSTNGGGTFSDLAGATSSPLSVATTDTSKNGYQYRAVFSNGTLPNATSTAATLTVNAAPSAPSVTTQPANQTITAGASASFSAAASGNPAPTVQWQVSTNGGGTFSDLAGATTSPLSVATTDTSKNGYQYRAVFSNGNLPNATSIAATLTVNAVSSTTAPVVAAQPSNKAVSAGGTATFTASASGNPTPTVQWQVSTTEGGAFTDVAGATSTTLTIANTTVAMSGYQYRAVFSNGTLPNATSSPATLSVLGVSSTNPAPALPSAGIEILQQHGLATWPVLLALMALFGAGLYSVRRRSSR